MTKSILAVLFNAILILLPAYRGNAAPWARHAIDPANAADGVTGADGVKLADINGDGRFDIVTGWEEGNRIRFYLQPELVFLATPSSEWISVAGPEGIKHGRIELLDLDGDGDLDIITCEERTGLGVVWYENPYR